MPHPLDPGRKGMRDNKKVGLCNLWPSLGLLRSAVDMTHILEKDL